MVNKTKTFVNKKEGYYTKNKVCKQEKQFVKKFANKKNKVCKQEKKGLQTKKMRFAKKKMRFANKKKSFKQEKKNL